MINCSIIGSVLEQSYAWSAVGTWEQEINSASDWWKSITESLLHPPLCFRDHLLQALAHWPGAAQAGSFSPCMPPAFCVWVSGEKNRKMPKWRQSLRTPGWETPRDAHGLRPFWCEWLWIFHFRRGPAAGVLVAWCDPWLSIRAELGPHWSVFFP